MTDLERAIGGGGGGEHLHEYVRVEEKEMVYMRRSKCMFLTHECSFQGFHFQLSAALHQ